MRKTIAILMLLAVVLVGGISAEAKTTKKKSTKSKTAQVVAKAKVDNNSVCSTVTFSPNGNYSWGNCDSGPYTSDNGAFIGVSSRNGAYLFWEDNMYLISFDTPGAETLVGWLAGNAYDCKNKLKQIFSFDPDSEVLSYTVDGKSGRIKVSDMDGDPISWIKR